MRFIGLCGLLLVIALMPACGKKPTFVDPPPEANLESTTTSVEGNEIPQASDAPAQPAPSRKQKDPFPHLYPKPWL